MESLQSLIRRLDLQPLPREGGWFRQYYLSPERNTQGRPLRSAIHFVLAPGEFSAWHRMATSEIWTFVDGAPVEHFQLSGDDEVIFNRLGRNEAKGGKSSVEVAGGTWQAARTTGEWSWVDCVMCPAWEEKEFELGERAELARQFPGHVQLIAELTRGSGD